MRNSVGCSVLVWLLLGPVTGCDSTQTEAAAGARGSATPRKPLNAEAVRLMATMVSAVSGSEGASSVDLKFELTQRPQVGKPVDISMALIPTAPLERLHVRFQPEEGLELVKGQQTEQIARPVSGAAIAHTLTVIPQRDGIFTLSAVVLTDSSTESVSRSYSIPVIVGKGLSELAPRNTVARTAAYVESP